MSDTFTDAFAEAERVAHRRENGHWLMFVIKPGLPGIVGCFCGFMADEGDCGFGDSVIDHIEAVVRAEVEGERDRAREVAVLLEAENAQLQARIDAVSHLCNEWDLNANPKVWGYATAVRAAAGVRVLSGEEA